MLFKFRRHLGKGSIVTRGLGSLMRQKKTGLQRELTLARVASRRTEHSSELGVMFSTRKPTRMSAPAPPTIAKIREIVFTTCSFCS